MPTTSDSYAVTAFLFVGYLRYSSLWRTSKNNNFLHSIQIKSVIGLNDLVEIHIVKYVYILKNELN
jgi:hypothetical protein